MRELVKVEWRLLLREPVTLIWGIVFPILLLAGLGALPGSREADADLGGLRFVDVYVPVMIAFVFAMLGVSALPSTLAMYRERGVLRRLGTTPLPVSRVLAAQAIVHVGVIVAAVLVMLGGARIAFGVTLPEQPFGFVLALALTAAAVLGVGLVIAAVATTGKLASGIGTALFFPLMFFAGLWFPRDAMPDWLQAVSDFTPLGAAVGALQTAMHEGWPQLTHLAVLVGFAVAGAGLAGRLFRWD